MPPDHSAAGALLFDLAKALQIRGWEVWIAGTRQGSGGVEMETCEGVHFARAGAPAFSRASLWSRFLSLPATWCAMWRAVGACPRPDILVTMTDPPLSVCAGAILSLWMRCPHVHWCQDLYPQVAAAAGVFHSRGIVCRALQFFSELCLKACDHVVVVGRCMQERLAAAGIVSSLITNWSRLSPVAGEAPSGKFRILYSGNLGRAHDFEGLREASLLTRNSTQEVVWTVCGDGPQSEAPGPEVERLVPVSWEGLPDLLAGAHAHLVTLRSEFCGLVVPSKLYDAAASGRAVIFAGPQECECARVIKENAMGIVVPDRDGAALAEAAAFLAKNPEQCRQMGAAAREFGLANRLDPKADAFAALLRLLGR